MKRETLKKKLRNNGLSTGVNSLKKKIQNWIACIPYYLEKIRYLKGDNCYKKGRIDGQSDTKAGRIYLAQLEAEMAQAQEFVTKFTPHIYYGRSMSISFTVLDSSNTSSTLTNTLRGAETQRTPGFQDVPLDTAHTHG